jgi:hypothetical protein
MFLVQISENVPVCLKNIMGTLHMNELSAVHHHLCFPVMKAIGGRSFVYKMMAVALYS